MPSLPWRLPILACVLAATACSGDPAPAGSPSLTVSLAAPQARQVERQVRASGTVAAWEDVAVGVELSGLRVATVEVEVGSVVKQGDVLLRLDARTLQSQLAEAEAGVAEAAANLDVAERKASRVRTLAAEKLVSQQDADEADAARVSARSRLNTAVASRDAARVQRDFSVVRAPVDGVVSARSVHPGQVVAAGSELLRLIREGRLEWRAELAEADLLRVAEGATVRVDGPGGAQVTGQVRRVSPALDAQRRTGTIYADLPEPGPLRAGMFAEGRVLLGQGQALLIPAEAVVRRDGRAFVFTVDAQNRAHEQVIEAGATHGDQVEVRAGLEPSDRVVARGAGFLGDGDLVRVVEASAAAATTPPAAEPAARPGDRAAAEEAAR